MESHFAMPNPLPDTITRADLLAALEAIDGGAAQPCESWSTPESFACGIEQEGSFLVQIGVDEVVHDEAEVLVEADECHVIGEALELQLDA